MDHDPDACTLCAHAKAHGWWGHRTATHCHTCGATWDRRTKTTHCVTCHLTFSTPRNCDAHQRSKRTPPTPWGCRDPATEHQTPSSNAFGTPVWHSADTNPNHP